MSTVRWVRFCLPAFFLFTSFGHIQAETFIAPYAGALYVRCIGASSAATSQFGTGTSQTDFIPYLANIPQSCSGNEVFVRSVRAGEAVAFGIYTWWDSRSYWAFSTGIDRASLVSFTDTDNSLRIGGKVILQTSQSTWIMNLDDAASYLSDDDDNDMLIQLRLAGTPSVQRVLPQFVFGGGWPRRCISRTLEVRLHL